MMSGDTAPPRASWTRTVMAVAAAVAVASVACGGAAAQSNNILLNTDALSYRGGDVIIVYGQVPTVLPDEQMRLQILHQGTVLLVDQFDVAADGTFTYIINTDGSQWTHDGQYAMRVWYGNDNTSVYFDYMTAALGDTLDMFEVDDGRGGTFDMSYAIRGGVVDRMGVDYDGLAINVQIDAQHDGQILLDLPRRFINATGQDGDVPYIVLLDGVQVDHADDMGADIRRIMVNFTSESADLLVIGTQVVPEFGGALAVLAAGTIASALAYRLRARAP